MSTVKNQHYVPQSYLTRFTDKIGQIWVFDKPNRRSFGTDVKNVASGKRFYDFSEDVRKRIAARLAEVPDAELPAETKRRLLDPQVIEKDLARQEHMYAHTLGEVIQTVDATGGFTEDQQSRLAYFLAQQLLRTRAFRDIHIERTNKVLDEITQVTAAMKFGGDAVGRVRVSMDDDYIAYEHARMMYNPKVNETFTTILLSHLWHIGINNTRRPLYTSDSPVIMRSHLNQQSYGIGSPGIEIMFPLDPWHILILGDRAFFAPYASAHRKTLPLDSESVRHYNSGQVLESHRQVYCSASVFDHAADICARHPHVCVPDRERIQVIGGVQSRPQLKVMREERGAAGGPTEWIVGFKNV